MAIEIWGFQAAWAQEPAMTDGNHAVVFDVGTKSRATFGGLQDNDIILFYEISVVVDTPSAGAHVLYFNEMGMPRGMFVRPITVAADKLFARMTTSGYTIVADCALKLFVRPKIVSALEWMDAFETFRG